MVLSEFKFGYLCYCILVPFFFFFFFLWFFNAVIPVDLKQTVQVDKDLQIRAYYAGHVRLAYLKSKSFLCLHGVADVVSSFLLFFIIIHKTAYIVCLFSWCHLLDC